MSDPSPFKKHRNLDRVTLLSSGFLMLFIAFNSAANLSGQALKNDGFDGLGFFTMATLYLFFSFCSFFSSGIVNSLGAKWSLIVGGLCYSLWVLCFLPPAFYPLHKDDPDPSFIFNKTFITFLSLFSAAVNGFGAGVLWVAQGKYVAECATDANKGFFFGYFWAFFMASQVLGNLIAALILGRLAQSTYYVVMSIVAFSGTAIFLFLRKPVKGIEDLQPILEGLKGDSYGAVSIDKSKEEKIVQKNADEPNVEDSISLIRQEELVK